jgi:pyruvate/2-oxoglutarate/acetoin dehydrogenase E1 component
MDRGQMVTERETGATPRHSVLAALNAGLHQAFAADPGVILLGEDVLDPYGGAFKVTKGLSSVYPERVWTTPISEAGIVGVASGMALRGMRPVVEIMFGDFLTLAADQIINHAAKFRWMYNDQVRVPLVIRTPMGGRRGYGPTHSQTLEKLFLGVPGLRVVAVSALGDPGELLKRLILEGEDPTLFIENKLLYALQVFSESDAEELSLETDWGSGEKESAAQLHSLIRQPPMPAYRLSVQGAPPPVLSVAAYGYMAEMARQAMVKMAYEKEIFIELVVPTRLAPVQVGAILDSAINTGRLLVLEEGSLTSGWGAEVIARLAESSDQRTAKIRRLAALDLPVPASGALESAVLPGMDALIATIQKMV